MRERSEKEVRAGMVGSDGRAKLLKVPKFKLR